MSDAIAYFIAVDMMAYNVVEGKGFKKMMSIVQPKFCLPKRRHFSDTKIPKLYNTTLELLKRMVVDTEHVALTTDCWTSASMEPYMAIITAHFINDEFEMVAITIA